MAAKRHQRGRADIDCVRAKRDRATTSALERILPPAMIDTSSRIHSSRRRWSTAASASSMGIPTLSRMRAGAAPVPP